MNSPQTPIEHAERQRLEIGLDLRDAAAVVDLAGSCQPATRGVLLDHALFLAGDAVGRLRILRREFQILGPRRSPS